VLGGKLKGLLAPVKVKRVGPLFPHEMAGPARAAGRVWPLHFNGENRTDPRRHPHEATLHVREDGRILRAVRYASAVCRPKVK